MPSISPKHFPPASGREAIADHIRQQIMSGRLRFGQKVSESAIAANFGVSRTPVREAILSLASLELLQVRPRSGTYVVSFTKHTLSELFDVRFVLEVSGVKLASSSQRAALVQRLSEMMPSLTISINSPELFDAFSDVDTAFHTSLVACADNDRLLRMYRPVETCAQAARSRLEKAAHVAETANAHHADILGALAANDIWKFEIVLGDHLAWVLGMLMHVHELFEKPIP